MKTRMLQVVQINNPMQDDAPDPDAGIRRVEGHNQGERGETVLLFLILQTTTVVQYFS